MRNRVLFHPNGVSATLAQEAEAFGQARQRAAKPEVSASPARTIARYGALRERPNTAFPVQFHPKRWPLRVGEKISVVSDNTSPRPWRGRPPAGVGGGGSYRPKLRKFSSLHPTADVLGETGPETGI